MPSQIEMIKLAIQSMDSSSIIKIMFDYSNGFPKIRPGFGSEGQYWDFKNGLPSVRKSERNKWYKLAADILGFHNAEGGVLIFGIDDKSFHFDGCTEVIDAKQFNDKVRFFLGDRIYVSFNREFIQKDQKFLGIAIVPPRKSEILRFLQDGCNNGNGEVYYSKGDIALRDNDETKIFRGSAATQFLIEQGVTSTNSLFAVDLPGYKILAPDYCQFVYRNKLCNDILQSVRSNRTFVTSLTGIGGVGKTALACWALNEFYNTREFDYIVSISAKDRELSSSGIIAIKPMITSFTELIDQILGTIGFLDNAPSHIDEKIKLCRDLIKNESLLILVDNLETIDDTRIISFLEDLPDGVKAIVTSRKLRVKVATKPIEIGPFSETEAVQFFDIVSERKNKRFLIEDISKSEKERIVHSCDHIPLVIEWFIGRTRSSDDASSFSHLLQKQGLHSEDLLDFTFRNIFSSMDSSLKSCLEVLATFDRPLPLEAISVGAKLPIELILDAIEDLKDYALLESRFDNMYRDNCYFLLPVTRAFINGEIKKNVGRENQIRKALSKWYEAEDIKNISERELVREIRRGGVCPEMTIVELAKQKKLNGELEVAESLFKLAVERNPKSWQALREYGEFCRHERQSIGSALKLYEQAEPFVPKKGADRALFYREWAIISRQEGLDKSAANAIARFEASLKENPNDRICRFALGQTLHRAGQLKSAIAVLQPLEDHEDPKTRFDARNLLLECYNQTKDFLKEISLKRKIEADSGQ